MEVWYSRNDTRQEMFWTSLNNREFSLLVPKFLKKQGEKGDTRYLRILNRDGLKYALWNMTQFLEQQHAYNAYFSLAKYENGLPCFSHVLRWRNAHGETDKWSEHHWKQISQYDCLIDIDSPDRQSIWIAKEDCKQIMDYLDDYKVPYSVRFSGMGYHIIIPYQVFLCVPHHFNPHENVDDSIYKLYNEITLALNKRFSEFVDTDLHDSRRCCKIPYSLAFYDDACFVCWPFECRNEFVLHNPADYKLDECCHYAGEQTIFKRGVYTFNKESMLQSKPILDLLSDLKLKKWVKQIATKENNT